MAGRKKTAPETMAAEVVSEVPMIASYENVVYTEDNMKQAKADRAELNNLVKAIEERRKMVKKIINEPYDAFEKELKEILALIQEPVGIIDRQVKAFEDQQKEEKKKSIQKSYDEVIGDLAEVLPFERVFDSRYLNQTYKLATAQQSLHPPDHFVHIDGLYHIIIRTQTESFAFVGGAFLGCDNQDGHSIS